MVAQAKVKADGRSGGETQKEQKSDLRVPARSAQTSFKELYKERSKKAPQLATEIAGLGRDLSEFYQLSDARQSKILETLSDSLGIPSNIKIDIPSDAGKSGAMDSPGRVRAKLIYSPPDNEFLSQSLNISIPFPPTKDVVWEIEPFYSVDGTRIQEGITVVNGFADPEYPKSVLNQLFKHEHSFDAMLQPEAKGIDMRMMITGNNGSSVLRPGTYLHSLARDPQSGTFTVTEMELVAISRPSLDSEKPMTAVAVDSKGNPQVFALTKTSFKPIPVKEKSVSFGSMTLTLGDGQTLNVSTKEKQLFHRMSSKKK